MNRQQAITIGVMLRHIEDKGGITVYTKNILDRMFERDPRNQYLLFLPTKNSCGKYAGYPNVEEVLLESKNTPFSRLVWDQWRVLQCVKKYHVDVVFNPKLSVPLFAGCKTVFTMHGLEQFAASRHFMWHDRLYFKSTMCLYCRKADAILCMTEAGKTDMQRYLGVPAHKIYVIPESYNERCTVIQNGDELERIRDKFRLPQRFILFVGGITPLKNVPTLLRAVRMLKQKGYEHKLVIVGFRRWKYMEALALVKELGLEQEVIELGFVNDEELPAVYNLADCFVLPSFYEGFGIPILEAQACGCPVVISNPAPMQEVAGGAALTFDPDDSATLVSRIESFLKDDNLRRKTVESGLRNAQKYRWETTARKTIEVFEKIAQY